MTWQRKTKRFDTGCYANAGMNHHPFSSLTSSRYHREVAFKDSGRWI